MVMMCAGKIEICSDEHVCHVHTCSSRLVSSWCVLGMVSKPYSRRVDNRGV